jgi:hypothetical protein
MIHDDNQHTLLSRMKPIAAKAMAIDPRMIDSRHVLNATRHLMAKNISSTAILNMLPAIIPKLISIDVPF